MENKEININLNRDNNHNSNDIPPLLTDLMQGDEKVASREDFNLLSNKETLKGLKLILDNPLLSEKQKELLLLNTWRINYKHKPPTMKEFLSPEWIGPQAESLFVHVNNILSNFWEYNQPYRHLILAGGIGTGKSVTSTVHNLYTTTQLFLMRNPKRYFGLAPSSSIVQAFISFSQDKAKQLLLQPFMQILLSSNRFHRVKQEELLEKHQRERPNQICWSTSSRMGVLQFYNDIHYIVASSPSQFLGLNMIMSTMSEISFFIERGFSTDFIWRIYQDSKTRIKSRFGTQYLSGTVLDSSPNDIDLSPIDKYIFTGLAAKEKDNFIVTGSQWELYEQDPKRTRVKELYPIYAETGQTFPVFRGSSSEPAKIISVDNISSYNPAEILYPPIDVETDFLAATTKSVKDIGGWPSGSLDKLIRETKLIEDIFTPQLKNVPTYITLPTTESAKGLLWKRVKDKFFIKIGDRYEFYRCPRARRVISFDLAETGDAMGVSMSHWEYDLKRNEKIIVHDFTLAVSPNKGRINIDAARTFPEDLRNLGGIDLFKVTFDGYQSHSMMQYIKEQGFEVEYLSADTEINVYLTYVALINIGVVKAGRNIFLKNNLNSIQETTTAKGKRKIDHTQGKVINVLDSNDWNLSRMGTCAKDVSDTAAENAYILVHQDISVPHNIYDSSLDVPYDNNYLGSDSYKNLNVAKEKSLISLLDSIGLELPDA